MAGATVLELHAVARATMRSMFAAAFRSVLAVVVLFLDATYLPVRPSGPQEGVIDLAFSRSLLAVSP